MFLDVIADTLIDALKLLPFLFVTYLVMEYIEHKAGDKAEEMVQKAGRFGPFIGSILGVVPQCGFSAAASNLYAGRIITLGTLLSIYLSTSDEMLPIFISEQVPILTILRILGIKVLIGMAAGFAIDLVIRKKHNDGSEHEHLKIEEMCDHQHCHCGEGKIWKSALSHTLQIIFFIIVVSFVLNLLIEVIGEDSLSAVLSGRPVIGCMLAGIIGLIPNCAASVVLTQLYLEGMLSAGSMIAGLLVGAGVGLLVLFRVNENLKENLKITVLLYGIGVVSGILIETAGLVF
ncbi:MAG: arsenic efflux protein [Lachnospiraceae bacterium]|nr:arsenic efflux protein [Lachnospiraceae bacterium]